MTTFLAMTQVPQKALFAALSNLAKPDGLVGVQLNLAREDQVSLFAREDAFSKPPPSDLAKPAGTFGPLDRSSQIAGLAVHALTSLRLTKFHKGAANNVRMGALTDQLFTTLFEDNVLRGDPLARNAIEFLSRDEKLVMSARVKSKRKPIPFPDSNRRWEQPIIHFGVDGITLGAIRDTVHYYVDYIDVAGYVNDDTQTVAWKHLEDFGQPIEWISQAFPSGGFVAGTSNTQKGQAGLAATFFMERDKKNEPTCTSVGDFVPLVKGTRIYGPIASSPDNPQLFIRRDDKDQDTPSIVPLSHLTSPLKDQVLRLFRPDAHTN